MKIAIVKLSALGDIIHAMVALQFMKKNNPDLEIDWVVEERYKELLKFNPDINQVLPINIKQAKKMKSFFLLIKEFRRASKFGPYDLVIDMQGLVKSSIISRLIPSKLTLGFDKSSVRERVASIFYNKTFRISYDQNIVERNFELIKFAFNFSYQVKDIQDKLPFLYSNNKYLFSGFSSVKKNIVIIPGASVAAKRYPIENFVKLINLLDANYFIIWGNDEEKLLAKKIKKLSPSINICEKLSIEGLIELISRSDLVLGPDTGPTHMAWALNVPSITLFGPTPGYRNSCITKVNKVIESKSKVNPYNINKNDYSIKEIDVREILKVSKGLLN
tara:strand:- start:470 stop:1465 length:996 start_codon:yes stop_codon:yes gene_type:complete